MRTNTTEPILVVGSVNTLAAAIVHQDERAALHNYADQRAVLDCKPLRGLRAVHECGGLYVIVRECPHAPDNYEVIAENLTAEHARQICEAVNGRNEE